MPTTIANGVKLHCLPTTKFKTIRVNIYFKQKLSVQTMSQQALMARLLDVSTDRYPSQTDLHRALSQLYGAVYHTQARRLGQAAILKFSFVFPNSKLISQAGDLQDQNIEFINQAIFHPHAQAGAFDPQTFDRQQANLLDDIRSLSDDKQAFARLRLNQLYYPDPAYQLPATGGLADIEQLTPHNLYQAYVDLIESSGVHIMVMGDVDEDQVADRFSKLAWADRTDPLQSVDMFYRPTIKDDLVVATDQQDVHQSKFNLAYESKVYYWQDQYFAGLIFNGLFGGYPHSKLFLNVREKASLAYYASSHLSAWTGKLTVQTGIDTASQQQAQAIIADQLKALQDGDFSQRDIDLTKKALANSRYQNEDSSDAYIRRLLQEELAQGQTYSLDQWLDALSQVNKDDIIQVAQQTDLKATYFLSGGGSHA